MPHRFRDRREAGQLLAERLAGLELEQPLVLGLPRGGVPVAAEVARLLGAPLDVLVVRKLGVPWHPELGMGAVGEEGVSILNDDVVTSTHVTEADIAAATARERAEVDTRVTEYRQGLGPLAVAGRVVVIVDDGLATGGTAKAAIQVARARGARRVVLAIPVAPFDALAELGGVADDLVCLSAPVDFQAVGAWYDDFRQTSTEEVVALLGEAERRVASHRPPGTDGLPSPGW